MKGVYIMRYEEIVERVKNATSKANVSRAVGHIAFQFNVEGEGEGAFYLEISDGKVYVEPYEYYDRDVVIVTTADVLMQMTEGGLQPMVAYTNEQIRVYGNIDHLKVLPLGCECKQTMEPAKAVPAEKENEGIGDAVSEEPETVVKAAEIKKPDETPAKAAELEKRTGAEKKLRKRHLRK